MKRREYAQYEVVVVGGGMAGLCAALASARNGAKTALVQARPVLGGCGSSEIRIHINSASDGARKPELEETGILYELMLKNKMYNPNFEYCLWDMTLFEAAKQQENLTTYLNTCMIDAVSADNHINEIICFQETTEKQITIKGDIFIDATGNGTLGYFVDAEYRIGSEAKSEFNEPHAPEVPDLNRMGNTILFRAIDMGHPVKFTPPSLAKKFTEHDLRYRVHSNRHQIDFSMADDPEDYKRVSTSSSSCSDYGYWWLELMGDGDDIIPEYENIRDQLNAYLYGVWDHIKNGGDHGAENFQLIWVGTLPGMRESRRLVGDYLFNENDVYDERIFDDAIAFGGWGVDLHADRGAEDLDVLPSKTWNFDGAYTIPYRSYYSKNIDNLMMAGRDISCSRLGMASTRIIATCAVGGQGVGTAAALCRKYNCNPRELMPHIKELQQTLLKQDAFLPGFVNEDEADFARKATFTATSETEEGKAQNVNNGIARTYQGHFNGWQGKGVEETLTMHLAEPVELSSVQLTFDSNFHYPIRVTMAPLRQKQQRPGVPMELVKDYTVKLYRNGEVVKTIPVEGNYLRQNVLNFEKTLCDKVDFEFHATNGADVTTVFEVRAY